MRLGDRSRASYRSQSLSCAVANGVVIGAIGVSPGFCNWERRRADSEIVRWRNRLVATFEQSLAGENSPPPAHPQTFEKG